MKVILNAKVDLELREELKDLAEKKNRTLSNLVETVLRDYVKHELTALEYLRWNDE